ncbi:phage integrase N-terminal SAM-like domain-containing protein [Agarivorans sp. QJM3NY_29]|uniref:phage integrase N-terminal SAM-like domain-containing protein n=1 Tax=unclassified Agarivorans TaxID=2636026 RepID=UPI003F6A86A7
MYFYHKQHPAKLGAADIERFLTHLTVDRQVAPATQTSHLMPSCFSITKYYVSK